MTRIAYFTAETVDEGGVCFPSQKTKTKNKKLQLAVNI